MKGRLAVPPECDSPSLVQKRWAERRFGRPAPWGAVFGGLQAASPLAFWWLDPATVYALGLVLIASVYIGFAVADGRRTVIMVESGVATIFVVIAAASVTGSAWLLVLGLGGHGLKDLAQELGDPPGMGSVNTELKVLERAGLLARAPRERGERRMYPLRQPSAYWELCQELRDETKVRRAARQHS